MLRFRAALLDVGADALRGGVQRLPKQVSAQLHKTAGVPFPALAKMPDPVKPLRRVSDVPLLDALADTVMRECYQATLELLGDKADEPSVDDLREVLPALQQRFPAPLVRLVFASVAISTAVAADACDELVTTDLPEPDDPDRPAATAPVVARAEKKGASDEQREARKERRRAQQEAKRKQQDAKARAEQARRDAVHAKNTDHASSATDDEPAPVAGVTRRAAVLTVEQAKEFDPDDPLAGRVVVAAVPFDDGPAEPGDPGLKRRPCIVVAGNADSLLVRPCYSEGGLQSRRWQSHALRDWRGAGFDKPSFVEDEAVTVLRTDASEPGGEVSAEDWNSLW